MNEQIIHYLVDIIGPAVLETIYMTVSCMFFGCIIGHIVAVILLITGGEGLSPNKIIYNMLDFVINLLRSFPFIILIVTIIPLTRLIAGTSIGTNAAIVPLTIAMAPYIARIFENAYQEVDKQLIEAGKSFGLTNWQIIFHIIMVESIPSVISGMILATITAFGATAMAGAVGAKGLGAIALIHGYQSFNVTILYLTVGVLIIIVQIIQSLGRWMYEKLK